MFCCTLEFFLQGRWGAGRTADRRLAVFVRREGGPPPASPFPPGGAFLELRRRRPEGCRERTDGHQRWRWGFRSAASEIESRTTICCAPQFRCSALKATRPQDHYASKAPKEGHMKRAKRKRRISQQFQWLERLMFALSSETAIPWIAMTKKKL